MKSRDETITRKILSEISDIRMFTEGMDESAFLADVKTQKAVVMSLINIGELSKSYTDEFLSAHASIPWHRIRAMRNLAAHKYEMIKPEIVWDTIQISLPELEAEI